MFSQKNFRALHDRLNVSCTVPKRKNVSGALRLSKTLACILIQVVERGCPWWREFAVVCENNFFRSQIKRFTKSDF